MFHLLSFLIWTSNAQVYSQLNCQLYNLTLVCLLTLKHLNQTSPAKPHLAKPYLTKPYQTEPYHTPPAKPHQTVPCRTKPHLTLPYPTEPDQTLPYHTVPAKPHHTAPYLTKPYRTRPYLTCQTSYVGSLNFFNSFYVESSKITIFRGTPLAKPICKSTYVKQVHDLFKSHRSAVISNFQISCPRFKDSTIS